MNGFGILSRKTLAAALLAAPGCVTIETPGYAPCPPVAAPCHNAEAPPPPVLRMEAAPAPDPAPVTPPPPGPPASPFRPQRGGPPVTGPALRSTAWHAARGALPCLDGPGF